MAFISSLPCSLPLSPRSASLSSSRITHRKSINNRPSKFSPVMLSLRIQFSSLLSSLMSTPIPHVLLTEHSRIGISPVSSKALLALLS
ncbi:unnamed protein product [Meloidogyne enterolobii]|uniref:Uncharacterized protein n=1 Tax=Meloidogyne enterolobii TaxID=390850 RepID=A0ACB0XXY7_MELEN